MADQWRRSKTLFEQLPALGAFAAHGRGAARLVPVAYDQGLEEDGYDLREGVTKIGRDSGNDIVIKDRQVSRFHCEIHVAGDTVWVKDLGSGNGTWINRERIEARQVRPGDEIWVSAKRCYRLVLDEAIEAPRELSVQVDNSVYQEASAASAGPVVPTDTDGGAVAAAAAAAAAASEPSVPASLAVGTPAPAPRTSDAVPVRTAMPHIAPSGTSAQRGDQTVGSIAVAPALNQPEQQTVDSVSRQRDLLALLYQVSMRCLMAPDRGKTEELLTNVVRRVAPVDAGFLFYPVDGGHRASAIPGGDTLSDQATREVARLAVQIQAPVVLDSPAEVAPLGVDYASVLLAPLLVKQRAAGALCCFSRQQGAFNAEVVEVLSQLSQVATAALIHRTWGSVQAAPKMEIERQKLEIKRGDAHRDDVVLLHVGGRLDASTAEMMSHELSTLIQYGNVNLLLEMSELEYVSSAGLRALLLAVKQASPAGGKMVLCAIRSYIQQVFAISGFAVITPIFDTLDEALSAFD